MAVKAQNGVRLVILFILLISLNAEDMGRPSSLNADRVIDLTRLFLVDGDSDRFFLKNPTNPVILPGQKGFLVSDSKQLLHFDMNGEFLRNIQNAGEGPGEWGKTRGVLLRENGGICVICEIPEKLIFFDSELKFQRELRFDKAQNWLRVFCAESAGGLFFSSETDLSKATDGVNDLTVKLKQFNAKGQVSDSGMAFTHRVHQKVRRFEDGGISVAMKMLDPFFYGYLPQKKRILLADHETYRLKLVDFEKRSVIRTLTRPYKRQAWVKKQEEKKKPVFEDPPFFMDIIAVVPCIDRFWVFTSLLDKQNRVSVDVIGSCGTYLDCFWLSLPGLGRAESIGRHKLDMDGKYIVWIHTDDEHNPMISVLSL